MGSQGSTPNAKGYLEGHRLNIRRALILRGTLSNIRLVMAYQNGGKSLSDGNYSSAGITFRTVEMQGQI